MNKIFAFVLSIIMAAACMAACSPSNPAPASDADGKTVKVGICNYVDDASLNLSLIHILLNHLSVLCAQAPSA